jgi:hypothetical protein
MASEDLQHTSLDDSTAPHSQNLESVSLPLREAVAKIISLARRSGSYTVDLAIEVADLKARLLRGEAGLPVRWSVWIADETKLSRQYVYFLAKIGSSPDPAKALKDAQKGWRDEKSDGLSLNHKLMLKLIPKLSDCEVKDEYVRVFKRYRSRIG